MLRRLRPLDKAMVLILVPLWAVCFGLGIKAQVEVSGIPVVGLSFADEASYPELTGEFLAFFYAGATSSTEGKWVR